MSQKYPFRSSALTDQALIEADPKVYPFREDSATETVTNKPRLIEDAEDATELVLSIAVLAAICVSLLLLVELIYPGWAIINVMEVANG